MEIAAYIDALDGEGRRLLDAARRSELGAPVPTCPGWCVRDLLAHVHYVHRWAATYVGDALTEMVPEQDEAGVLAGAPPDDALLAAFAEGHAALVGTLRAAPADLKCWTFLAAPTPLAMWARRQAHETAIHRVDAELAAGGKPTVFEPEFAADGVDELLIAFLGRRRPESRAAEESASSAVGTIGLEASDHPGRWSVQLTPGGIETSRATDRETANWDLSVRGTTADLYLLLWNRPASSEPKLSGAVELLDVWRERVRVSWS